MPESPLSVRLHYTRCVGNAGHLLFLFATALVLAACLPPSLSPAPTCPPAAPVTCTPAPPLPCSPAPPLSCTPVPSILPTVAPTPRPPEPSAIQATVEAGASYAARTGIQPLCMRQENTDGDPDLEWVGLYLSSGESPRLQGFILDGLNRHDLIPPESEEDKGLGEFPTCKLEVRDLNADGRVEIVIWGHTQAGATLLHIFVWDGGRYALLAGFEGKGGIRLENRDGDLADEVVVRWRPEGDLVWEVIYTWDGTHYAWTWDRYAWFYLDRPHAYPDDTPVRALASFYLALNDRDLPAAYRMLSPAARSARTYEDWALGFATTLRVEVGAVRVTARQEGRATIAAQVRALDNVDGRVITTVYAVEWQMVRLEEGWRLDWGTAEPLERWEVRYYP